MADIKRILEGSKVQWTKHGSIGKGEALTQRPGSNDVIVAIDAVTPGDERALYLFSAEQLTVTAPPADEPLEQYEPAPGAPAAPALSADASPAPSTPPETPAPAPETSAG